MTAPSLALDIETWLLTEDRWVPAEEIAARYGIEKRALRARGRHPGLLDDFAASSGAGYKHVRHLTDEEADAAFRAQVAHIRSVGAKLRRWHQARHRFLTGPRPELREALTGQRVMPGVAQ